MTAVVGHGTLRKYRLALVHRDASVGCWPRESQIARSTVVEYVPHIGVSTMCVVNRCGLCGEPGNVSTVSANVRNCFS